MSTLHFHTRLHGDTHGYEENVSFPFENPSCRRYRWHGCSGDARALDSEAELEELSDPEVLELAVAEGRVLVTANIRDFEPLLREWAGASRSHAGVMLVPSSVRNEAFGVLISDVEETLADIGQEEWVDRLAWLRKA